MCDFYMEGYLTALKVSKIARIQSEIARIQSERS